jgi:hypothetical protein
MANEFQFDVFLSHSAKDKAVVREVAARLHQEGACYKDSGFPTEEIFNLTKIDRRFLVQIKEIVDFEEELARQ